MATGFTILAVCTGNIHRSALAASLLDVWRGWYLGPELAADVVVRSAGFAAPAGARIGRRAGRIAAALGAQPDAHRAVRLTDDMVGGAQLVLTATRRQRDDVLMRVPSALRMTFTMREAGRIAASLGPREAPAGLDDLRARVAELADARVAADDDDIIDPQGLGDDAYQRMVREEVPALAHLAARMFGMPHPDVREYLAAAAQPELLIA